MEYMDLLSRIGVASAHPGGFSATRNLLDALGQDDVNILEVGCGTGKSTCFLAKKGLKVTALDQHPLMLEKAKRRAEKEGIHGIEWVLGNVQSLPFENDTFDIVFAESVTIFTDIESSLREYHRVLKPGGRLLDRELVLHAQIPEPIYSEIKDYFKMDKILTVDEWLKLMRDTGFRCDSPRIDQFWSQEQPVEQSEIQDLDITALFDPEIAEGILKYAELMLAQEQYFRACDFMAKKISQPVRP